MAKKKRSANNLLAIALLEILLGVIFLLNGAGTGEMLFNILITVLGVIAIVMGVLAILAGNVVYGVFLIVIGAVTIALSWTLANILILVIGVLLLVYSIIDLTKKKFSLGSLVQLLCGLSIVLRFFGGQFNWGAQFLTIIAFVCGVILLVDGIILLAKALRK